jgi:hypothetical protein
MHKLVVTGLMVVGLALAPGLPAPAATGVEYAGVASQKPGGGSTNPTFGSVKKGQGSHKKRKAKG